MRQIGLCLSVLLLFRREPPSGVNTGFVPSGINAGFVFPPFRPAATFPRKRGKGFFPYKVQDLARAKRDKHWARE